MPRRRIRRAQIGDARAIAAIHVLVWRETYANLLPAETLGALSVERRSRQWHDIIGKANNPDGPAVFVAEDERNAIVGFGCCNRQRSKELAEDGFNGEFQAVYVMPSSQRCGLGRNLMAEMAHHLTGLCISGASCWVLRENDQARHFYEALGGRAVGERVDELEVGTALFEVAYGWHHLEPLARK